MVQSPAEGLTTKKGDQFEPSIAFAASGGRTIMGSENSVADVEGQQHAIVEFRSFTFRSSCAKPRTAVGADATMARSTIPSTFPPDGSLIVRSDNLMTSNEKFAVAPFKGGLQKEAVKFDRH
jgi:hypothetical protein